ncbi:PepSY domain-containing protein [Halothiobacillus sp.]|uniref:PepSY domain-containing protein n=1 Tax=Halothiobacillus sp. TaxID=1891311 RepID=UPI0026034F49|nr:PepSY domain-containing protein [Halothiobacillus sp.]MDD3577315.1 PepSY domain-containing protein [Halothiobacillus sp.]MDD4966318.1 PepSY domain-containing protein [Halothiobacillus sp.]
MRLRYFFIGLTAAFMSTAAQAGPQCTQEPRSAWMPADKVLAKATQEVPKLKLFKVTDGNCFEIYGWGKAGEKLEIYYHPVTGEVVKRGSW